MDEISTMDALRALGLGEGKSRSGGTKREIRCPFCAKQKMYVDVQNGTVICFNASCDFKGNTASLYAKMYGLPWETKEDRAKAYQGLRELVGGFIPPQKPSYATTPKKEVKESSLGDIHLRDKAYKAMLSVLTLSDPHMENLKRRGLGTGEIIRCGYKTTPGKEETRKIEKALKERNIVPEGVPGFFRKHGAWTFAYQPKGILIPVRDDRAKIQGLQIRLDNERDGKARWVSSIGKDGGCGAETFVHFSCERQEIFGELVPTVCERKNGRKSFLITEGPMKADIIHALSGADVIALAGVNAQKHLVPALKVLKGRGVDIIYDAFDMDYVTNDSVRAASEKMRRSVEEAGMAYSRLQWNRAYKGLDDYLLAKEVGLI